MFGIGRKKEEAYEKHLTKMRDQINIYRNLDLSNYGHEYRKSYDKWLDSIAPKYSYRVKDGNYWNLGVKMSREFILADEMLTNAKSNYLNIMQIDSDYLEATMDHIPKQYRSVVYKNYLGYRKQLFKEKYATLDVLVNGKFNIKDFRKPIYDLKGEIFDLKYALLTKAEKEIFDMEWAKLTKLNKENIQLHKTYTEGLKNLDESKKKLKHETEDWNMRKEQESQKLKDLRKHAEEEVASIIDKSKREAISNKESSDNEIKRKMNATSDRVHSMLKEASIRIDRDRKQAANQAYQDLLNESEELIELEIKNRLNKILTKLGIKL